MRERGFEPLWFNPLDPKSSASASSATLACLILQGYLIVCQTFSDIVAAKSAPPAWNFPPNLCILPGRNNMVCKTGRRDENSMKAGPKTGAVYPVLASTGLCHLLNDSMASLLPAVYPMFKSLLHLNFTQVGLMALTFSSRLPSQPVVGLYTDRHPKPFSLPAGFASSFFGLLLLASSHSFLSVIVAIALIGVGSSVFHPEGSRAGQDRRGGRYGLAQSIFRSAGTWVCYRAPGRCLSSCRGAVGHSLVGIVPLVATGLIIPVSLWYKSHLRPRSAAAPFTLDGSSVSPRESQALHSGAGRARLLQVPLHIEHPELPDLLPDREFHISIRDAQIHLFLFLVSVALGTVLGGP